MNGMQLSLIACKIICQATIDRITLCSTLSVCSSQLMKSMEDRGGPLAKTAWVNTLFRRFQDADDNHTGALDK